MQINIYKEFEDFVKAHGTLIETRESHGGVKTAWQVKDRTIVIDENPFREEDRIVIILKGENPIIEYLSPSAVQGGAMEQLSHMMNLKNPSISSPAQLERVLKEIMK